MDKDEPIDAASDAGPATETRPRGRVLALDLGAKRVGVAVSDETRLVVRPLPALRRSNRKQLFSDAAALCEELDVREVVVGLPLRLDGSEGDAATDARRAADALAESLGIPVRLQDERLTSFAAEEALREQGFGREEIKRRVDSEAAAIILRDFLEQQNSSL